MIEEKLDPDILKEVVDNLKSKYYVLPKGTILARIIKIIIIIIFSKQRAHIGFY